MSAVITNEVQIGQSATNNSNFHWRSDGIGRLILSRGRINDAVGDVMFIDSSGVISGNFSNVDSGDVVIALSVDVITSPTYTVSDIGYTTQVLICDTQSNGINITLPNASVSSRMIVIKKINANYTLVVTADAGDSIDGGSTASWTNINESITIVNANGGWWLV